MARKKQDTRPALPKMNAIDRAVAYLDPIAGERRLKARLKISAYSAYEGASRNRRLESWSPKSASANEDLLYDLSTLRDRARDLVRNTPHAANAARVLSARMVGTGITPRFKGANADKVDSAWKRFVEQCDFDGDTDFYGLQALASNTMVAGGESLTLFKPAPSAFGLRIPLQLQVIEPDHLDDLKNVDDAGGGRRIVQGVELDARGRRAGFWLFDRHPGDRGKIGSSRKVSPDALIHLYRKDRPGQLRAAPWLAPVMVKMRHLDDYDEAELYAKKLQASIVSFIKALDADVSAGSATATAAGTNSFGSAIREEETSIGMQYYLRPGEDVTLSAPPASQGYEEFTNKQLHDMAAGLGITYEMLTGDLSQVNYTSFKAGEITFRTYHEQLRWHLLVPKFCQRVMSEFLRVAEAVGEIDGPPEQIIWTPPRYESVDPWKDYRATVLAVRSGLMSLQEAISELGYDPDVVLQETSDMNARLDELGIIYDSDPRRTTSGGAWQSQDTREPDGDDNGNDGTDPAA